MPRPFVVLKGLEVAEHSFPDFSAEVLISGILDVQEAGLI
jgi:hypothetical protein